MRGRTGAPFIGTTTRRGRDGGATLFALAIAMLCALALSPNAVAPTAEGASRAEIPGLSKPGATGAGDLTIGSKVVTNVTTSSGAFEVGQAVSGEGISTFPLARITSVGSGTFEMSENATETKAGSALTAGTDGPCGTATDSAGNLYVAEFNSFSAQKIKVYSVSRQLITEFTAAACSIAINASGEVYGVNPTSGVVTRYKPSSFPPTGATTYAADSSLNGNGVLLLNNANAVAVDPATQGVFVSATAANEVQTFTRPTLAACGPATKFSLTYNGVTKGELPCTTATLAEIEAVLKDPEMIGVGNFTVAGGTALKTVTFTGALGNKNIPAKAIVVKKVEPPGNPIISESNTTKEGGPNRIASYDASGTLLNEAIGTSVPGAVYFGVDVYGSNGRVYAVDGAQNKVYVFNAAGSEVLTTITGSEAPKGAFAEMGQATLAVDQTNGNVLVSDIKAHEVVDEFNAVGKYISQLTHTPPLTQPKNTSNVTLPSGLSFDNSSTANKGSVYVTSGSGTGGAVYAYGASSPAKTLSITVTPGGSGTVKCNGATCSPSYSEGSAIELSASPEPGFAFKEWKGGTGSAASCNGSTNSNCTVVLTADSSITAEFKTAGESLTIIKGGFGTGVVDCEVNSGPAEACAETYPAGTNVKLKATPNLGSTFGGFSGDCTGGTCELTMSGPKTVTATFNQDVPTVTNVAPGAITSTSIVLKGTVNNNGADSNSTCKFVIATEAAPGTAVAEPACSPNPVIGSSSTPVEATATGLTANTKYVYRVVATNAGGASTGTPDQAAETLVSAPTVTNEPPGVSTQTSIVLKGSVDNEGAAGNSSCKFVIATQAAPGTAVAEPACSPNPVTGNSPTPVEATATGLTANTKYVYRVVATNAGGTSTGTPDQAAETLPNAPTVSNAAPGANSATTIVLKGSVDNEGAVGGSTCKFVIATEAAPSTAVGEPACSPNPVTGDSSTSVEATATGLTASTKYVYRVVATNTGGTSTGTPDQAAETLAAASPTITGLDPNKGPTAGGNSVTVTGTNLQDATFKFGANPATGVSVNPAGTSATMTAPSGSAGTVNVIATTTFGDSPDTAADNYTYVALPTITGVSPNKGPTAGGNSVTVTGTNLQEATFKFGANLATGVSVNPGGTSATMTAPGGSAGTVNVIATTAGGPSVEMPANDYTYVALPTITGVSPNKGPTAGGNSVTVTGTNLQEATFKFGANNATGVTINPAGTSATMTAPGGSAGTVNVIATTAGGPSVDTAADNYTYVALPTITGVSPNKGPVAGGNSVTVTGTNLQEATFKFGANNATGVTINPAGTSATMTAPGGSAGAVNVIATTAGGDSANTAADDYTYVALPTITGVSPSSGSNTGGTPVTVTGTNLEGATFKFGPSNATGVVITGGTSATMTSPSGVGTVDVIATTAGGSSANTAADNFTYFATPTVTGVSPDRGPLAGGTAVTIKGTNFTGATAVKFGSANAASFIVVNATTVTATSPAGTAGSVSVSVTTLGGTSANTAADDFAYVASHSLTVNKAGGGGGTVSCDGGPCAATYLDGTKVTLTAAPDGSSVFAGWSGACSGTGGCAVMINDDTTVTASFDAKATVIPPPPPATPSEGTVKSVARTAPVSGGKASIKLTCSGGPCSGQLKMTAKIKQGKKKKKNVVIGKASFNLAAGESKTIKVKLSSAAKKVLNEGKTLKATLSGPGLKGTVKLKPGGGK